MHQSETLSDRFIKSVQTHTSSTFFLNGLPRTGKTNFLGKLRAELVLARIPAHVMGPYRVFQADTGYLIKSMTLDLYNAAFIDRINIPPEECDLTAFWEWAATQIKSSNRVFLIMIDVGSSGRLNPQFVAAIFSSARKLEDRNSSSGLRIHTIFEGYWDPYLLDTYYKKIGVSFPYTPSYNYGIWLGIDEEETVKLTTQRRMGTRPIMGKIIHEITGGNPSVILGILDRVGGRDLSLDNLTQATRAYAIDGNVSLELAELWSHMPTEAKKILLNIILKRRILGFIPAEIKQLLMCAGLISETIIEDREYIGLRSWYVELVVLTHANNIGLSDPRIDNINPMEFVPELTVINHEAYQVINDIENRVRNFAVRQRYQLCSEPHNTDPLDVDITIRGGKKNIADVIRKWKARSEERGMLVDINPRIVYSTTSHLRGLLEEIAGQMNSVDWLNIALSIDEMRDIRDAVMHNQIISDRHLERLYQLRASIYMALDKV